MFPDLSLFYMEIYGGFGYDFASAGLAYQGLAAGIPQVGNPPYSIATFLATNPKFFGPPILTPAVLTATSGTVTGVPVSTGMQPGQLVTGAGVSPGTVLSAVTTTPIALTGTTTAGSATITAASSVAGLIVGQPIAGAGIPAGATILSIAAPVIGISAPVTATAAGVGLTVTSSALTLSTGATASGAATLSVYANPPVALPVIQLYLNLAYASLMSSKWREWWPLAMGLYIAHFLTLWEQSDGNPQSTVGAIVNAGLERGLTVSKSADGLSLSLQPLAALGDWGAWAKTTYGTQLITQARVIGAGPIYVR